MVLTVVIDRSRLPEHWRCVLLTRTQVLRVEVGFLAVGLCRVCSAAGVIEENRVPSPNLDQDRVEVRWPHRNFRLSGPR